MTKKFALGTRRSVTNYIGWLKRTGISKNDLKVTAQGVLNQDFRGAKGPVLYGPEGVRLGVSLLC